MVGDRKYSLFVHRWRPSQRMNSFKLRLRTNQSCKFGGRSSEGEGLVATGQVLAFERGRDKARHDGTRSGSKSDKFFQGVLAGACPAFSTIPVFAIFTRFDVVFRGCFSPLFLTFCSEWIGLQTNQKHVMFCLRLSCALQRHNLKETFEELMSNIIIDQPGTICK
jgi:hypothetical protein